MAATFDYTAAPARILFGPGALGRVSEAMGLIEARRALVLSTPNQEADARRLADQLGDQAAGVFAGAAMHTPVAVTEQAVAAFRDAQADATVALGGGSTTGLGKAIAYRLGTPQIAIPTTYAGSEVTPILGQTEDGVKTTVRGEAILPDVVIYDPELTVGLPVGMTITSGMNAVAHAVEGLYAQDRNPIASMMAAEGMRAIARALPVVVDSPRDLEARGDALYGAWLCGAVLGSVGMALHHKLCHTLGGSLDLPHAETHTVVLPHATAYNASAAAEELAVVSEAFGGASPGAALFDFTTRLGAPVALRDLGMREADIERAAEIATRNPYWNPKEITQEGVAALLRAAWAGERPDG